MSSSESVIRPEHLFNRELSWLEFNQRVLDEALDPANPLLERLKFFCITASNLDEFFEVRVAGVKQQIESEVVERTVDGRTATELFQAMTRRIHKMIDQQYRLWNSELVPELAKNGIRFLRSDELTAADTAFVETFYKEQARPVLTPLSIDPSHPFPQLLNKTLNMIVELEWTSRGETEQRLAVVQIPRVLPRLVRLPRRNRARDHAFLGDIIGSHLGDLFPGTKILGWWRFRVTRNGELYIDEEDTVNLLKAVENELHNRRKGDAVRLEIEKSCPPHIRVKLLEHLKLTEDDVYIVNGPINPAHLMSIYEGDHSPELRDPPFVAPIAPSVRGRDDLFAAIRERDVLLHHPYESFDTVVRFLQDAAADPNVLAIKQTLYRTGGDPRVVGALMDAVKRGKQVTAVVELKARFDEANNIQWSRKLEEAGVHVVYGLVGYKIHGKITLVVRRDPDGIRRYVHLSTGNYNASTARLYTDIGLFTAKPEFGEDATNLFNLLTGICQFQGMRKFLVAPFELHSQMLALVERETANARQGLPARIIAKMNSLVDEQMIAALYDASKAGVNIDLIVRGTCCLRPRVRGLSDNIRVISIVDRFLEHPRIFYFENACRPEVYMGSADWMPRNFFRRIEIVFPVEDGNLRERIISEILALPLADTVKAKELRPDGTYTRVTPSEGDRARRSQFEFIHRSLPETHAKTGGGKTRKHPAVVVRRKPEASSTG